MYDELKHICEILENELANVNKKLDKSGGVLSGDDISYIDKLTHSIKSIKTTIAMMEADGGESGYYMPMYGARSYGDESMRDGESMRSSYARRRDSMGRYTSRRGGMSYDDGAVEELRDLMDRAPNESIKREYRKLIEKIEQM